ncbi:MAG: hypothetical protein SO162_02920 [Candidatus Onthomorpha sp.]|nr:hypothetical protein [Candidatus Onthomorpha sp.]
MKYSIKKLILLAFVLCIGDCLMADRPVVNVSRSNGELVAVSSGPFGIIKDTYVGYKFVEQSSTDDNKTINVVCREPGVERCKVNYGAWNKPRNLVVSDISFPAGSIITPAYEMLESAEQRFSNGELSGSFTKQISVSSDSGKSYIIVLRAVWALDKEGNGYQQVFADILS